MPPSRKPPPPGKYPQVVLRADQELIDRVDAFAERQSEPGRPCSRGAAIRILLLAALDRSERKRPK